MSSGIKHKMYDYEVTPPSGVWNKITSALDDSDLEYEYPSRIKNIEVVPPAAVWNKISAELNTGHTETTQSSAKTFPIWRYAAAAAIIAFLAWGGFRLINNNTSGTIPGDEVVKKETTNPVVTPVEQPVVTPTEEIVKEDVVTDDEVRNEAALEASKKTYAKLTVPARSKIKNAAGFHFSIDNIEPLPPVDADPATRYIMLMTPDGNVIRMSKKLSNLVCCVSGEEQDAGCVDQLKKWREKVASSSAAYSPGNFGDLLHLVKSLQE
jgi:hypothetical protein